MRNVSDAERIEDLELQLERALAEMKKEATDRAAYQRENEEIKAALNAIIAESVATFNTERDRYQAENIDRRDPLQLKYLQGRRDLALDISQMRRAT